MTVFFGVFFPKLKCLVIRSVSRYQSVINLQRRRMDKDSSGLIISFAAVLPPPFLPPPPPASCSHTPALAGVDVDFEKY